MGLENIRVVLARPIYSGNIGSVCRAMKNMGITDLALVSPQQPINWQEARTMACHADDVLARHREFATLPEALADCSLAAGTTARQGLYRAHCKTARDWAPHLWRAAQANRVALVFGAEDSGLTNAEIAHCTNVIRIPSSPEYPSLNLAQAVLICCYELFLASETVPPPQEPSVEATIPMREKMFQLWREALLSIGFMKGDKADHMMMGLRRIFGRAPLTEKDVRIMVGIARQALWAGQQLAQRHSQEGPSHERKTARDHSH